MSDNHKNALKTAFNDVTGDTIKTGKGSLEKYAQGWEGIFGKAVKEKPMEIGHFMVDDSHVIPMLVEDYMCPNCVTPWKCNGPHIEDGIGEPATVMALDFHDGAA